MCFNYKMHQLKVNLLPICLTLLTFCKQVFCATDPCPNIFQYKNDGSIVYGLILVPIPANFNNLINLEVEFTVGHRLEQEIGSIEVLDNYDTVEQKLQRNESISFRLNFPTWRSILPQITQIKVNGNSICRGNPITFQQTNYVDTVTLSYDLKIYLRSGYNPNRQEWNRPENSKPNSPPTRQPSFNEERFPYRPDRQSPSQWNRPDLSRPNSSPNSQPPFNEERFPYGPDRQPPSQWNRPDYSRPNSSPTRQPSFNEERFPYGPDRQQPSQWTRPDFSRPNSMPNNQPPLNEDRFPFRPDRQPVPEWNRQDIPVVNPPSNREPPIWQNSIPTNLPSTPFNPLDGELTKPLSKPPTTQPFSNVCGLVSSTVSLIANAQSAKKSDYPWLGALFRTGDKQPQLVCGASMITDKHALTAGHCVEGFSAKRFYLVLGREYIYNWLSEGEHIQVESTIIHNDIKVEHGDGDIAIVALTRKVTFSPTIRPICLWNDEDDINRVIGENGVVVGWGEDEQQRSLSKPKQTSLPIVTEQACLESNDAFNLLTSNRTFCAGYRNETGPCKGDSGSGFYMKHNGRWTIRGIVSQALGRNNNECDLTQFVVFVDVAKFRDWILTSIST